ncbi:unnamed protein product [Jaminaea pallidilutea]
MRAFVTGGSGLMGCHVIPQLLEAGHSVLALARSDDAIAKVRKLGAEPVAGSHKDLAVLRSAALQCDAAIHLAFNHQLHFAGGAVEACEQDRAAITAICDALTESGTGKTFINSSGTLGSTGPDETCGKVHMPAMPRDLSENLTLSYAQRGLRVYNVRLSPVTVASGWEHPFLATQIARAKANGFAAYIGDGSQVWPSVNAKDAAALYVLALTQGTGHGNLHAVAQEGIAVKDIATFIGGKLSVATKRISLEESASLGYGFVGHVMSLSGRTTAEITKKSTGWQPRAPDLWETLQDYKW